MTFTRKKKKHNPNWIYYATFSKVYYHQGFESEVSKEISKNKLANIFMCPCFVSEKHSNPLSNKRSETQFHWKLMHTVARTDLLITATDANDTIKRHSQICLGDIFKSAGFTTCLTCNKNSVGKILKHIHNHWMSSHQHSNWSKTLSHITDHIMHTIYCVQHMHTMEYPDNFVNLKKIKNKNAASIQQHFLQRIMHPIMQCSQLDLCPAGCFT